MTVQLKPETARLVQEEISSGNFHSVDEIIVQGVEARREQTQSSRRAGMPAKRHRSDGKNGKKSLAQLFAESPFKGLSMNFERFPDILPPVDL
jgi:Arc/MetJ-type ribon-helix-helix transcriptional regulator